VNWQLVSVLTPPLPQDGSAARIEGLYNSTITTSQQNPTISPEIATARGILNTKATDSLDKLSGFGVVDLDPAATRNCKSFWL